MNITHNYYLLGSDIYLKYREARASRMGFPSWSLGTRISVELGLSVRNKIRPQTLNIRQP